MASHEGDGQVGGQQMQENRQDSILEQPQPGEKPERGSLPLLDDEEIIIHARPAWSAFYKYFIIAGIVVLAGIANGIVGFLIGVIIAGAIGGYVFYLRQKLQYLVTDRRVMVIKGIASKDTTEAWMVDIEGLKTGSSLLERFLGHGHVKVSSQITSAGFGIFDGITFGGIDNHEEIAEIIRERQNEEKM